jgi:RNA polymerase sigma-70 factor (ECF subfamily)
MNNTTMIHTGTMNERVQPQPSPDDELVQRALGGDRPAFEELYRKTVRRVFNLVLRLVGTVQEAEEITQEVFTQVYRNLGRFEGRSSFYTWVFRIATNVSLQYVKWRARRAKDTPLMFIPESQLPRRGSLREHDPEQEAERRALYRKISEALTKLPPGQRVVLVLGPIQGHSYEEMSKILGISTNVIKGRLHRARENLRDLLRDPAPAPAVN